jgi:hypothetical protein
MIQNVVVCFEFALIFTEGINTELILLSYYPPHPGIHLQGLHPDPAKHQTYFHVEPHSGVTVAAEARVQGEFHDQGTILENTISNK